MSRAAADSAISSDGGSPATGAGEIMLFGVRVVVDSMRKSVSMNNLSQYEHPQDASNNNKEDSLAAGYASADESVPQNSGSHRERERERKRGSISSFCRLLTLYMKFSFNLRKQWSMSLLKSTSNGRLLVEIDYDDWLALINC